MDLQKIVMPPTSFISTAPSGVLSEGLGWVTPSQYKVPRNGLVSSNAALLDMLTNGGSYFLFTPGTYLLTDLLEISFTKDVHIRCEPGVVFKLAPNVRKHMLHFFGDYTHNFSWEGGELDGNWDNQGGEVLVSGHVDDVSHGLVISRWNVASLENLYAHDCMGHHINHAGNTYFSARNVRINSHISTNFPAGGARGDGITGVSKYIYLENIRGYSSDDLIGLFPGATWIPGETDPAKLQVDSITVRNITAESKQDGVNTRYTWHAVTAGCWNGAHLRHLNISDITGECQDGGVRVRAAPSSGDDLTLYGDIDYINIDGVSCYVAGKDTDQYETCPVLIGSHQQSMLLTDRGIRYGNVHIRNVQAENSGKVRSVVMVGHVGINNLIVSDVSLRFKDATDTCSLLTLTGPAPLPRITASNLQIANFGGETDLVLGARAAIRLSLGSTSVSTVRGTNIGTKRSADGNSWIANTLYTSGFTNRVTLFGYDLVVGATDNFVAVNPAPGCFFTDRYIGRIRRDVTLGGWAFDDWCTVWDSTNFGRPNATNFPGYAKVTDWAVGTVVKTAGSPLGECQGWVCTLGGPTPTWGLLVSVYDDANNAVSGTALPTAYTPRVLIRGVVISGTGWPAASGTYSVFTGAARADRAGAYREFSPVNSYVRYISTWDNSAGTWGAWKTVTYA